MTSHAGDAMHGPEQDPAGKSPLIRVLRGRAHLRIQVRWLIASVLVVIVAATAGWLGWRAIEHHRRGEATARSFEAATSYAATCNISVGTVDEDVTTLSFVASE